MTTRQTDAGAVVPSGTLLAVARTWRSAEVHAAAIRLGLRSGDQDSANRAADKALNDLRITTDHEVKANGGGEGRAVARTSPPPGSVSGLEET